MGKNESETARAVVRVVDFKPRVIRAGGVPTKAVYRIVCSRCGCGSGHETDGAAFVNDPVFLAGKVTQIFSDRGWVFGKERTHDVCPDCVSRAGDALAEKEEETLAVPTVWSPADHLERNLMPMKKGGRPGPEKSFRVESVGGPRQSSARAAADAVFKKAGTPPTGGLSAPEPQPRYPESSLIPGPQRSNWPPAGPGAGPASPVKEASDPAAQRLGQEINSLTRYFNLFTDQMGKILQLHEAQFRLLQEMKVGSDTQTKLTEQLIKSVSHIVPAMHEQHQALNSRIMEIAASVKGASLPHISAQAVMGAHQIGDLIEHGVRAALTGKSQVLDLRQIDGEAIEAAFVEEKAKRPRRSKAEMEAARAEDARLKELGLKRGRGRPRKHPLPEDVASPGVLSAPSGGGVEAAPASESISAPAAPAMPAAVAASGGAISSGLVEAVVKRGRGRPRKEPKPEDVSALGGLAEPSATPVVATTVVEVLSPPAVAAAVVSGEGVSSSGLVDAPVKRGRGRPRKDAALVSGVAPVEVTTAKSPKGKSGANAAAADSGPVRPARKKAVAVLAAEPDPVPAKGGRGRQGKDDQVAVAPVRPTPMGAGPVSVAREAVAATVVSDAGTVVVKRGRGRPRKDAGLEAAGPQPTLPLAEPTPVVAERSESVSVGEQVAAASSVVGDSAADAVRRRGRPRLVREPVATVSSPLPREGVDLDALAPSTGVLLYSERSKTDANRFFTNVQIERAIWDRAGFSTNARDALYADFDGEVLRIARQGMRRIKLKEATNVGVAIQIVNLGSLNLGAIRIATVDGVILMKGEALI